MQPALLDSTIAVDTTMAGLAAGDSAARAAADVLQIGLSDTLRLAVEASGGSSSGLAPWLIPALMALVGALIGAGISAWWQKKALDEKRREEERKDLYEKLNGFYGPVSVLLAEQRILTELFKNGPFFKANPGTRTLTALLRGHRFAGNEAVLLKEILATSAKIRDLIVEKGGLVEEENRALIDLLSQARAHYRIIQLAFDGKLSGEADRFAGQVYPNYLDSMVEARKKQLEDRLMELNQAQRLEPIPMPPSKQLPAEGTRKKRILDHPGSSET
jgi:hypothetical protein